MRVSLSLALVSGLLGPLPARAITLITSVRGRIRFLNLTSTSLATCFGFVRTKQHQNGGLVDWEVVASMQQTLGKESQKKIETKNKAT